MKIAYRLVLAIAIVGLAASCSKSEKDKAESNKKTPSTKTPSTKTPSTKTPSTNAPSADGNKTTLPSGVAILDLKVGEGTAAQEGDKVNCHATGWLTDGKKFWSSHDRGNPIDFRLRHPGGVIKGWVIGVAGMKPGGKRKIWIPSALAYGKRGRPPVIPGDSDLVFEVELMAIR